MLIFPAALFMIALLVRNLPPSQSGPAHAAQQIVNFYAGHVWTLWALLLALPLAALAMGCATLLPGLRGGREVALPSPTPSSLAVNWSQPATLLVAATTVTAAAILVIVVLHMAAN